MRPGVTVNERFEILSELGRGGMGVVYRARNLKLERDVAIKIFTAPLSAEANARAQREAKTLAGVTHPNLVGVHSLDKADDGRLMLVFDYVAGKPLSEHLSAGALPFHQASNLFHQLCLGLQALHDNGIIHRDIKPSNLLITDTTDGGADQHLTIIDFGLAKSSQSQKLTSTGTVMGTPSYMSPEQFASAGVSAPSDLYSAACVLFEMLCAKPPFEDDSPYMVATAHMSSTIPKLPKEIRHAAALNTFFETALAKEPQNRYPSAEAMWQAFHDTATNDKHRAQPRPRRSSSGRWKTKSITSLAALLLAVLGITIGILFFTSPISALRDKISVDAIAQTELHKIKCCTWEIEPRDIVGARNNLHDLIERLNMLPPGGLETGNVYRFYGKALLEHDDHVQAKPEEAIRAYQTAVGIFRDDARSRDRADVNSELAMAYKANGQWRDALETMDHVAAIRKKSPGVLEPAEASRYSHLLVCNGDFEKVLQIFDHYPERAERGEPGRLKELCRDIATAQIWTGQYQQALNTISNGDITQNDVRSFIMDTRIKAMAHALLKEPDASRRALADLRKAFGNTPSPEERDFLDACEAINLMTTHHVKEAVTIVKTISNEDHSVPPHTPAGREALREHIWNSWLCLQAVHPLNDNDLNNSAARSLQKAQGKLEIQGCIHRDSYKIFI